MYSPLMEEYTFTCVCACRHKQPRMDVRVLKYDPNHGIHMGLTAEAMTLANTNSRNRILKHLATCRYVQPYINQWAAKMHEKQPIWLSQQP